VRRSPPFLVTWLAMDGTRSGIVELLRHGDGLTVEALTESLGLAAATVRRHLDVLQRDGHVEREAVRRATGRPHYVFKLTQAGRDLAPGHYVGVTELLLSELLALSPEDTRGQDGAGVALLAFERMSTALLQACASSVTASSLPDRLEQTVAALAAGGLMLDTEPQSDGFSITVRDCPCRCAGTAQQAVCGRSEAMLAELLGAPLRRDEAVEVCSYFVKA
jgi:predicted ArsR family transcriptional regulator